MSQLRNYTLQLASGQSLSLTTPSCDFVRCFEGDFPFVISPDDKNPVQIQNGIGMTFTEQFNVLRIQNGTAPQTVQLYVGQGDVLDNRLITSGGIRQLANPEAAISVEAVSNVAASVLAENTNRSSVLILNSGAEIVYIGFDAGVTSANGMPIGIGSSLTLTNAKEIFAVCASASELRFMEEFVNV